MAKSCLGRMLRVNLDEVSRFFKLLFLLKADMILEFWSGKYESWMFLKCVFYCLMKGY